MVSIPDSVLANPAQYNGLCYRISAPRYANVRDALSGAGALRVAGRYHERGAFRLVYTATTFEVAQAEYFHTVSRAGFVIADLLPVTIFAITAQLSKVLDLTEDTVLTELGLTSDLLLGDWVLPQALGQAAKDAGYEAILAPSTHGGVNLNIFVENLLPTSTFEVRNPDKLTLPV
ncbi:RES family NAD+ phosphorylase [Armatimonas rosea]|uniref:RES family NAD+ phosphorylase n=1 Tax=Armatimonas rosea TaxID=685828 RepID=UPI00160C56B1|nr:RES family NAD+ phosphorylase [Armatimonas rosea]